MITSNKTYFWPTQPPYFMDILTFDQAFLDPVTLYDLARFVEDFVLSDEIYVSEGLYNMLQLDFIRKYIPESKFLIKNFWDDDEIEKRFKLEQMLGEKIVLLDKLEKEEESLIKKQNLLMEESELLIKRNELLEKLAAVNQHYCVFEGYGGYDIIGVLKKLYLSKRLTHQKREIHTIVDNTIKFLYEIGITVSPGFGFIIPVLEYSDCHNLTKLFYDDIVSVHKVKLDRLKRFSNSYFIYVPPLLSILLQRCENRDQIPAQLLKLRDEFSDLREKMAIYEDESRKCLKLKDKIRVIEDMEEGRKKLVEKISGSKKTSIIHRVWDVVKNKSLWRMFTDSVDIAIQWDEERLLISRVSRFVDIYNLSLEIEEYNKLLVKIFGANSINYRSFENMKPLARLIEQKHFPYGR